MEDTIITFKEVSKKIAKFHSGHPLKESDVDLLLKWVNDTREQLMIEKKTLSNKAR